MSESHVTVDNFTAMQERLEKLEKLLIPPNDARDVAQLFEPLTLETQVVLSLRERPKTREDLHRCVSGDDDQIRGALETLHFREEITNVGTVGHPRWFAVIGERGSPTEILNAVGALIRDRPMALQELVTAIGVPAARVSGSIQALARDTGRGRVMNVGSAAKARWFLVPPETVSRVRRSVQ